MSITHKHIGLGMTLVAAALFAGSAQAAYVWDFGGSTPPITIQDLIDNYEGEIIVGDKLFDNFFVSGTAAGGALIPNASGLNVAGTSNNGEFGLLFTSFWTVFPGQAMDSLLQFQVTALDPLMLIHDNTLAITGAGNTTLFGSLSVAEHVYVEPFYGENGNAEQDSIADKFVYWRSASDNVTSDHQIFHDPDTGDEVALRSVWIVKDILLSGGNPGTNGASSGVIALSGVVQTFSQIPEPASFALFGLGATMVLWRRRHA